MSWARKVVCASCLAYLVCAGCAGTDAFNLAFLASNTTGGDRVVAGSLDAVALSTQASLSRLGLAAEVTREGEAVYIASRAANGKRFKLVLTRERKPEGEHTRVRVEWEDGRDDQAGTHILSKLDFTSSR